MTGPYRPGQFVWCRFPTAERPAAPGPKLRIGYILDLEQVADIEYLAVLYTTTVPWQSEPRPIGVIPVSDRQAEKLDQKPFVIDARCIAILPVAVEYFPHIARRDNGVQGAASTGFRRRIESQVMEMRRRQVVVDLRGNPVPRRQ